MQEIIQFVVSVVRSVFDLCQQSIVLQWSLYTFVAFMLIKAYSVIWGARGSDISGSYRSGSSSARSASKNKK